MKVLKFVRAFASGAGAGAYEGKCMRRAEPERKRCGIAGARLPAIEIDPKRRIGHRNFNSVSTGPAAGCILLGTIPMKVRNSLKSLRGRHRDNQLVRRKGRVYIINKTQKRYKARQG